MVEQRYARADIQTINLTKVFKGGREIRLLRAEVPILCPAFTIIRYLIKIGEEWSEPEYGMRLDLDKRVFLDHLTGKNDRYFKRSAKIIVQHIASVLF